MNHGKTVFAQVTACVPHWDFQRIVTAHDDAVRTRTFSAWDQFLAMCFAQVTFRESLRDIEACLDSQPTLRYHLEFPLARDAQHPGARQRTEAVAVVRCGRA